MIVLNEHEWAKQMIESKSLGKKPMETIGRVARYYIDDGYSRRRVREALNEFLLKCDPTASLPRWSRALDKATLFALKNPAINIDYISISDKEMATIDSLDGRQVKRLAFTLLCLAKYWNIVCRREDGWVNSPDNEIMRMANINTSIKRQGMLYRILNELGLIRFSKKIDNTNVQVLFLSDGRDVLRIKDFRNLGYQYLKYCGESYFECQNCGITTKDNSFGRQKKYCKNCSIEVAMRQSVDSVMRLRAQK